MEGDLVFDLNNFEIINKIGEGENSIIFLVKDKRNEKQLTCKINKVKIDDTNIQKSFTNSICMISKIKYPSISQIFGYNLLNFDNQPFPSIISELFPNGSLDEILSNSPILAEWTNTKKYINIIGIALGMKYLHSNHIAHRNLKPTNILLDQKYYPIISDILIPSTRSNTILKKTHYIAPELHQYDECTEKSDVYSFGQIVYNIITNKRSPFIMTKISGEHNQDFIQSCLSEDPTQRPTFSEICSSLAYRSFLSLFENIDYTEVIEYLDTYEDRDSEWLLFRAIMHKLRNGENDKEEVIRYYQLAIEKGNITAIADYASMLRRGTIIEANKEEAIKYYKMAIERGSVEAMNNYAFMLQNEGNYPKNRDEVVDLYKRAIELGSSQAMTNYAFLLYKGNGFDKNIKSAFKYFKMAAKKGNSTSMCFIASMYQKGDEIKMDKAKAEKYYKLAVKRGNSVAMNNYALMIQNEPNFRSRRDEVVKLYKMAIDKKNYASMVNYGHLLSNGDKEKAANYYKTAADNGYLPGILAFAQVLKNGDGIERNLNESAKYYKMAADKGDTEGAKNYVDLLKKYKNEINEEIKDNLKYFKIVADIGDIESMNIYVNEMIEINQEEAIKYFKIAIDKGSADAMNNYAIMLQNGPNFPSNKKEVIHLYQLALKLRKIDKVAIYNYAMILWDEEDLIKSDNKKSVDNSYSIKIERNETNDLFNFAILKNTADQNPCNRKEAAKYIEMSANCGYEKAMLMYAHLLRSGEYVPLDKSRAAYFYKKLVDDGNVEAMLLYASMLENGESVPMDKNESQRLFKMAEKKINENKNWFFTFNLINNK